ncbi:MAG TPA: SRPBCC family protein [Thermoanaerobaculia bacterium]|nr:SRPBCC family protein [Thermoanaerobaculia bacterium]
MKSVVELDVHLQQARLAELFTDPRNNPKWMDDVERIEPISGELGEPGSVYRLVPKSGKLVFVATVLTRKLPTEATLSLDAPSVSVSVAAKFLKLSEQSTKLISEETFRFKGAFNRIFGFFARGSIQSAHRRHMESFKRFAESQG